MPKPLTVSKPFPTTENLFPDAYSLRIISPAYASSQSELNTILQYTYHSFFFEREGFYDVAETLTSISVAEMYHLNLLGKTILALGAAPVFANYPLTAFNFYSTKFVNYSCSVKYMLEDDILGERRAIAGYVKMLKSLRNEQVKQIISRIIEDEKLHLSTLEKILAEFKC